jgi:hypothetical protein
MHDMSILGLRNGVHIELCALNQYKHSINQRLEGLPTVEDNLRAIDRLVKEKQAACDGRKPYLIPPPQIPFPFPVPDPYPFGTPATVPPIVCIGSFTECARTDADMVLSIIWFQSHFAFPIAGAIYVAIQRIDWYRHATRIPRLDD